MDMLKNTVLALSVLALGASLSACDKKQDQGSAPASSSPAASTPGATGDASSSGGSSSSGAGAAMTGGSSGA